MDDATDHHLLLRMRRGDHAAAAALYARHAPRLLAYARARSRGADAEDAVQGAFLRALRTPESGLRGVRDVAAWLTVLVRSTLLNQRRSDDRDARRGALVARPLAAPPVAPGRGAWAELLDAVDALDEPRREVVLLRHFAGLTFDQLAEVLGEHRSTLASRYRAALNELAAALRRDPRTGEVTHAR